jgi:Chlamydia polymorphic membrane protein (Chlamydia_PMP) repeat
MKSIGSGWRAVKMALVLGGILAGFWPLGEERAAAVGPIAVGTEGELRSAWAKPKVTRIELTDDIALHACRTGEPIRESQWPVELDGNGHYLRQTCFEKRVLRQDGTGFVRLRDVWLTRGGSDGPGAAVTTRGEIEIVDSKVSQNLAEEPGGGVFSMRGATIIRSVLVGNLANDDGGAVYARRGGVRVVDSVLSGNLVDGSGGAIGSTGDVVVVRSHVDGNTTDGDGGAIYTDEDGDVTVVDSTVDGSTADGPGGAIFTLDGDVTIVGSTLNGNRADDRGGAISGEADVTVIGSTIARNAAVAHVGGGIWARGDLYVSDSTISNNYAEGQAGGIFGAGDVNLAYSTVTGNIAPVAGSIGAGDRLRTFGSIIGPPASLSTGQAQPTTESCRVTNTLSLGRNVASDDSCLLSGTGDQEDVIDPKLSGLALNGAFAETHMPQAGSPAIDLVPPTACRFVPFGRSEEGEQHLAAEGIDPLTPIEVDQRGGSRPFGVGCDAGAVESGSSASPTKIGPAVPLEFAAGGSAPRDAAATDLGNIQPARTVRSGAVEAGRATTSSQNDATRAQLAWSQRWLRILSASARRYDDWSDCLTALAVAERGDGDNNTGYRYDEVDGSGEGLRSALAVERGKSPGYYFFDLRRGKGCQSAPTVPGGTADPARAAQRTGGAPTSFERSGRLGHLRRKLTRLETKAAFVAKSADRFDRWESCLRWLPLTEFGDPRGGFGFEYVSDAGTRVYRAAVAVDRSPWDDPDYEMLVTKRRRNGDRACGGDPGESVDRTLLRTAEQIQQRDTPAGDLLKDARALREDVEDLREPMGEFETFDQCMFTLGMTEYGSRNGESGFIYFDGRPSKRPALAIDIDGFDRPQFDLIAFPGEEPPQIECNEDASGFETDE